MWFNRWKYFNEARLKSYEFLDHTADIIVKGTGDTLEEAFAAVAEGMFAVITGGAAVVAAETVELEVASIDLPGLLVAFLSELIVCHEVDGLVLAEFEVEFTAKNALRATGRGEKFDRKKHGEGIQVKGASYHMLEINPPRRGCPASARVLFDI